MSPHYFHLFEIMKGKGTMKLMDCSIPVTQSNCQKLRNRSRKKRDRDGKTDRDAVDRD